ncbi:MAG: MBL fold metallo-hydrolase [Bacteroidales bacterium]|nr:MBL fold metallo-hydrolase [Bacteroidales bacterium]
MKLIFLSDTKARQNFQSEHGLSFYIEGDQKKILFDTGASNVFLKNAEKLGLDLDSVDMVVLSHGHFDHGDGLQFIDQKTLICHPGCFVKRYRKHGSGNIGLALSKSEIQSKFDLSLSKESLQLSQHLFFLGEIPRINDFEARKTKFILEGGEEDFILDDSGLACITERGLVVISGCAHSGICNMIEHAKKVTGIRQVEAVIGGFHLKILDNQTHKTIKYLKETGASKVFPSHCTMDPALSLFYDEFGRNEVIAGTEIFF